MEQIMRAVRADFDTELVELNGENNHAYLLVNFPPTVAIAKLVNSLTGVSSPRMRQEFPDLVQHYHRANKLWSGSYSAGSVGGAPLTVLRQYIEQQNRPVQEAVVQLAVQPPPLFLGRADEPLPRRLQLVRQPHPVHRHGERCGDQVEHRQVGRPPTSTWRHTGGRTWPRSPSVAAPA
jgi:putative transposase